MSGNISGELNPNFKHGILLKGKVPKEYWVWKEMVARCNRKSHKNYDRYGARGITVCDEWMSFEKFYIDMCPREDGMTLERVDNNSGYSKGNCKWASRKDQALNRSNSLKNRNLIIPTNPFIN